MSFDEKILSIESDDDNENYHQFDEFLTNDTNRKKNSFAKDIDLMGNQFLKEIDRNNNRRNIKKLKLIPYILKYSGSNYTEDELLSYSLDDIRIMYNDLKKENASTFTKFFKFLFNI